MINSLKKFLNDNSYFGSTYSGKPLPVQQYQSEKFEEPVLGAVLELRSGKFTKINGGLRPSKNPYNKAQSLKNIVKADGSIGTFAPIEDKLSRPNKDNYKLFRQLMATD